MLASLTQGCNNGRINHWIVWIVASTPPNEMQKHLNNKCCHLFWPQKLSYHCSLTSKCSCASKFCFFFPSLFSSYCLESIKVHLVSVVFFARCLHFFINVCFMFACLALFQGSTPSQTGAGRRRGQRESGWRRWSKPTAPPAALPP